MNLLPFYDDSIADSLISAEIYDYFCKNIFADVDLSKITMDDLITVFSNKDAIDKGICELSMTMNDFFTFLISYMKDEVNLKQLTRSKKKIQELQTIIHDLY